MTIQRSVIPLERIQHGAGVGAVTADQVEHRKPAIVANDRLAIDDGRPDGQGFDSRRGERNLRFVPGDFANSYQTRSDVRH